MISWASSKTWRSCSALSSPAAGARQTAETTEAGRTRTNRKDAGIAASARSWLGQYCGPGSNGKQQHHSCLHLYRDQHSIEQLHGEPGAAQPMIISVPLVPPSPNELRRKYKHPHAYRKLRKLWEQELFYGASSARHRNEQIFFADHGVKMRVRITVFHAREFDADNLAGAQKPILDALVNIGFIKDDSSIHLELDPPEQTISKEKKTVIYIQKLT